jgi:hypothetical protein
VFVICLPLARTQKSFTVSAQILAIIGQLVYKGQNRTHWPQYEKSPLSLSFIFQGDLGQQCCWRNVFRTSSLYSPPVLHVQVMKFMCKIYIYFTWGYIYIFTKSPSRLYKWILFFSLYRVDNNIYHGSASAYWAIENTQVYHQGNLSLFSSRSSFIFAVNW